MNRYKIGMQDPYTIGPCLKDDGPFVKHEDAARILAQRDRLAELLREIDMGLALIGGFPCTSQKIKAALAELDKEKQQ